ncbi:MAG: copper chaperone PCu(A)C, partial [Micropepsaceae bacterium]
RLMVPPRGHLKFKSSGLHLMLLGLKAPLVAEEMVPVTLKFDKGVNIDIELYIEVSAAPEDDHTH